MTPSTCYSLVVQTLYGLLYVVSSRVLSAMNAKARRPYVCMLPLRSYKHGVADIGTKTLLRPLHTHQVLVPALIALGLSIISSIVFSGANET